MDRLFHDEPSYESTYRNNDSVSDAQVISFIARTFQLAPAYNWQPQPNGTRQYLDAPAVHDTNFRIFYHYAGSIPSAPTNADGWNAPAPRDWVARVLTGRRRRYRSGGCGLRGGRDDG